MSEWAGPMLCYSIIALIISLTIGLPCISMGCNEWFCPLQDIVPAMALSSDYQKRTCSCCTEQDDKGYCTAESPCDCSMYITQFSHGVEICAIETDRHYESGTTMPIFVQIYTHKCSIPRDLDSYIVWVGIAFCSIAAIAAVILVIALIMAGKDCCYLC